MTDRVIITISGGIVSAVHAYRRLDVQIINEDIERDGDAAFVAGLKHETVSMLQVYPATNHTSREVSK